MIGIDWKKPKSEPLTEEETSIIITVIEYVLFTQSTGLGLMVQSLQTRQIWKAAQYSLWSWHASWRHWFILYWCKGSTVHYIYPWWYGYWLVHIHRLCPIYWSLWRQLAFNMPSRRPFSLRFVWSSTYRARKARGPPKKSLRGKSILIQVPFLLIMDEWYLHP